VSKFNAQKYQFEHSRAKVKFYIDFLARYLKMLLSMGETVDEVHIWDVFCGRGIYENGYKGSAIKALETIHRVQKETKSKVSVTLHLNDIKREHTNAIKEYNKDKTWLCNIEYSNEDASDWMKTKAELWKGNKNYKIRNILFIDPYGYKQINRDILERLVVSGHADVLLFLPISFMYRFTEYAIEEDANSGALPLRALIEQLFDTNHPIRNGENMNVHQYIDYLTEAFRFGKKCYATNFSLERDKRNYFALFYMSKSLMGFEKIVEAKWEIDELNGCGFSLPKRMREIFEEEWAFERKNELYNQLYILLVGILSSGEEVTNATIYEKVLEQGFLPKHAKLVLEELQNQGLLLCIKKDTGEEAPKKSFYLHYKYYRKPCAIYVYKR